VFLGLVFGGIYLFKAPPSTAKTAPATSTSTATPDGRNPHPAEQEAVNDNRGKIIENQK
jgi:hypothetical protein